MTRPQVACYCLIASAFMLTGMLLFSLQGRLTPSAQAELVLVKDTFSVMTAKTRPDEEGLFVLDSVNQRLLIFRADIARKRIELAANVDLARMFALGGGQAGGAAGRRGR